MKQVIISNNHKQTGKSGEDMAMNEYLMKVTKLEDVNVVMTNKGFYRIAKTNKNLYKLTQTYQNLQDFDTKGKVAVSQKIVLTIQSIYNQEGV